MCLMRFSPYPKLGVAVTVWIVALVFASLAQGAELVMFEQGGCVYCKRWDRDVGSVYIKTDEAKVAPLRRVDIRDQKMSGIKLTEPIRYTPTFVLTDEGREIGRITGYISDDSFWGLLGGLIGKLGRP